MLKRFSVRNFRGFANEIELRLDGASDYHFNEELVAGRFVKNALIYGKNGSGKTSLLRAMAHIVPVLTDLFFVPTLVNNMDCGNSNNDPGGVAVFTYDLLLGNENIRYQFAKDRKGLRYEKVFSENHLILSTENNTIYVDEDFFPELRQSAWREYYNGSISLVKYLGRMGIRMKNETLYKLLHFAESFLLVRSVINGNEFAGFTLQPTSIVLPLTDPKNLEEFETFLKECGIDYTLRVDPTQNPADPRLSVVFRKESRNFFEVASSGSIYLLLLFYWKKTIGDHLSLLCIDEFDAYFHDDCAEYIYKMLSSMNCQVILTTHKTALMSNKNARPDVLFNLEGGTIVSFAEASKGRELREAHNIEKLYRNGAFAKE